jgi:YVTN family beta-propeller protein
MKLSVSRAIGLCLFLAGSVAFAQQRRVMAVAVKGLPGVMVFDADTDEVICKATTPRNPHEVAFSNNGRNVIVPIYGDTILGVPGSNERIVLFIRSRDCREATSVQTAGSSRPHGIALGKSGMLYLTTEIGQTVSLVDSDNPAFVGSIPTGSSSSHMLIVTPDEKTAFVSNVMSKSISVLDLEKRTLAETIDTGAENQRIDLAPDARQFVTSYWRESKIAFFEVATRKLSHTVAIDGSALQPKYSADGKFVYAVGTGGPGQIGIWKIDVAERKVVAAAKEGIGQSMASFSINPFNGNLYVADQGKDQLVVVNPADLSVVKRIATEKLPDGIAFATTR